MISNTANKAAVIAPSVSAFVRFTVSPRHHFTGRYEKTASSTLLFHGYNDNRKSLSIENRDL